MTALLKERQPSWLIGKERVRMMLRKKGKIQELVDNPNLESEAPVTEKEEIEESENSVNNNNDEKVDIGEVEKEEKKFGIKKEK